jgi:hypothetical protein
VLLNFQFFESLRFNDAFERQLSWGSHAKEESTRNRACSVKDAPYCTCDIESSRCSDVIEFSDPWREYLEIPNFCIL